MPSRQESQILSRSRPSLAEDLLLAGAAAQLPITYLSHSNNGLLGSISMTVLFVSAGILILCQFRFARPFFAVLGIFGFLVWLPPALKVGFVTLLVILGAILLVMRMIFRWPRGY